MIPFTERDQRYISRLGTTYGVLIKAQREHYGDIVKEARSQLREFREMLLQKMDPGSAANIDQEAQRQAKEALK